MVQDDGALETGVLLGVVVPEHNLKLDGLCEVPWLVGIDVLAVLLLSEELGAHHLLDLATEVVQGDFLVETGV